MSVSVNVWLFRARRRGAGTEAPRAQRKMAAAKATMRGAVRPRCRGAPSPISIRTTSRKSSSVAEVAPRQRQRLNLRLLEANLNIRRLLVRAAEHAPRGQWFDFLEGPNGARRRLRHCRVGVQNN